MEFHSIQLSSPSAKRESRVMFTTSFGYHEAVLAHVKPHSTCLIASYNVGITDDHTESLRKFLKGLCACAKTRLLVGINDHHDKNSQIFGTLATWAREYKTLEVRTINRFHIKAITIQTGKALVGFAGSLNFANISLHEVMFRLTDGQVKPLQEHLDYIWTKAKPFRPVQLLNKTKKRS